VNGHVFRPFAVAWVPFGDGVNSADAVAAALAVADQVVGVGLVRVPVGESLSRGVGAAAAVRRTLREHASGPRFRARQRVLVGHEPWRELARAVSRAQPDLLVLPWSTPGEDAAVLLRNPPADIALVRGPVGPDVRRVLVPVRGGPFAELSLRVGLALRPAGVRVLHVQEHPEDIEAPRRGLERVIGQLRDVERRVVLTADAAAAIVAEAAEADLVVIGAAASADPSRPAVGPVASRVVEEAGCPVIVVRTRRPMPAPPSGELAGAGAISILVDRWFAQNTYDASEFGDLAAIVAAKRSQGLSISLALPALNEAETVGRVISTIKGALMDDVPLLDEIVLVDSGSTDGTREIAAGLGVPVFVHQDLLPELGARTGKGEALWKSLLVTRGDIVAWIDTDIVNIHPRFVYGILGPLLVDPRVQFVKGFYRRPLRVDGRLQAGGGGRVTELMARPLLNLFFPELSGVIQPLSGEYAGRRSALERLPFFSGYGVETGLLIDVYEAFGLDGLAQVNLLERVHHNQPLEALSRMSFVIAQAVFHKLQRRHGQPILDDVNRTIKSVRYEGGRYHLAVHEMAELERPPMQDVPAYRARRERPEAR